MTKKFSFAALGLALCLIAGEAAADLINASQIGTSGFPTRKVTGAEAGDVGGGAPANGDVYEFRVTTDGDILSVFGVSVDGAARGSLFNVPAPFGSNNEPPSPAFIPLRPALTADSWVSTPGTTSTLGEDLPGDGVNTTFGDLTNDGNQTDFLFARLTVPEGTMGVFRGSIAILGDNGEPFNQAFSFALGIPEPATLALAGMGLIGFIALRRKAA